MTQLDLFQPSDGLLIEMLMAETGCSRYEAKCALEDAEYDYDLAALELTR